MNYCWIILRGVPKLTGPTRLTFVKSLTLSPLSLLLFTLQKKHKQNQTVSFPLAAELVARSHTEPAASTHIVVSRRPARVELGVDQSLLPSHLVIFGLFFFGQRVPLRRGNVTVSETRGEQESSRRAPQCDQAPVPLALWQGSELQVAKRSLEIIGDARVPNYRPVVVCSH